MQYLTSLQSLALASSMLTIGSFDGVHRGHQCLINQLAQAARANSVPSVVITFFPHPLIALQKESPPFYLTLPEEKAAILDEMGVDVLLTLPFDRAMAECRADSFLEELQLKLNYRGLWIGADFAFGYKREGDRHFLARQSMRGQFQLHVVPSLCEHGRKISSTRIRETLRAGDVAGARLLLGRDYFLQGKVGSGAGRGRDLGFPTANILSQDIRLKPQTGVYACWVEMHEKKYAAVINIGVRPTFYRNQIEPVMEAHLLNFDGDLYGEQLKLIFVEHIRAERKFAGADELVQQIQLDIKQAEAVLLPE